MILRLRLLGCLFAVNVMFGPRTATIADTPAPAPEESLRWSIKASKERFYPGEPVLLTLKITNIGEQMAEIDFGPDGIEAFSMEIRDGSNAVVAKGGKILRGGISRLGILPVPPGSASQKSVVLNQWCSTILPPGKYHLVCQADYRLGSEVRKQPGTTTLKAGPFHSVKLELDIPIVEPDGVKFKEILEELAKAAFQTDVGTESERADRGLAREMLAFTELDLGVPYQLRMLKLAKSTWLKNDLISSLARSETLEAATGLVGIIEDPSVYKEDVRREAIDAVYRLRETGKSEIIAATEKFVARYKRPILAKAGQQGSTEKPSQQRTQESPIPVTTKHPEQPSSLWVCPSFLIGVAATVGAVCLILLLKKKRIRRSK